MSYADAAAKGPKQSEAEKMPEPVPEVMHEDSGVHSLESLQIVDEHVQSIPSDPSYAGQQRQEELAAEARREAEEAADKVSKEAKDFMNRAEASAKDMSKDISSQMKQDARTLDKKAGKAFDQAKGKAKELGQDAEKLGQEAKKEGKELGKEAKKEAKKAEKWADDNKQNPVVVGNAVAITALGVLLSTGAYRMHKANTLTWNVVGAWAGAVGLFAIGDYYVSQYFFKKYPPKN